MKDAFYFPHDANAHEDHKMLALRVKCGWEGIGLYWTFIELLRSAPTYTYPFDLATLELGLSTPQATLKPVLEVCFEAGLLVKKDGFFYSDSLTRRMADADAKRLRLSEAGRKGARLKAGLSHPSAGKEKKRKESNRPTLDEVRAYCGGRGNRVDPDKWFAYYESNGWRIGKNPMKNWRAAVHTWEKSQFNQPPAPAPKGTAELLDGNRG